MYVVLSVKLSRKLDLARREEGEVEEKVEEKVDKKKQMKE